jgi:hypothetical protein
MEEPKHIKTDNKFNIKKLNKKLKIKKKTNSNQLITDQDSQIYDEEQLQRKLLLIQN